jgi:hypothetical protein
MREEPWYTTLREHYRPERVRLLLIGESAPDPGAGERRFFYAPALGPDNLFRGVVHALYDERPTTKQPWLDRLRADGVFLIDLVPFPVNKLKTSEKRQAHRSHVPQAVEAARSLAPAGIVICHGPTFRALAQPLRDAGLPLLHDDPIPFPLGNWRERFVADFRAAVGAL